MGNKKNRNPEKKERKRIEKEQGVGLPVQADVEEEIRKKFDDGFEHITNARYDKGIEIFTEALELISKFMKNTSSYAKNCATAYNYRGMAYYRNGEHDKALKDYNEAIRNNSNYADAYNNRGNVYSYKTKYDLAIKDYNETIKLDPNHAEAYNNIGSFYHNKNEYDLAIKNYNEAIRLNPNYANAYYYRGVFYQDKGYWPEAFYNYSKAIQINPNNFRAHHNRGNVCHNIGDYPQAIYNYDRSIELCPNDSKAHHNKGVALVALGENEEAKKNCKEWTTSAIEHHIKWTELCINQNIVDYTTSMFIYMLRHLLQKEKYNGLIPKINEQTAKYINTVIKYEHDENENEKEITECAIKTGDDKVILYKYSLYDDYAKDNIKNEQIYFSDPFKFNDSFDPLIRVLNDEHSEGLVKLLNFKVSCLSKKEDNLLLWSHYADKHQGICIAYDITDLVKKDNIVFRKIQYIEKFPKPQDGLILALSNMDDKTSKKETLIDTFTKKHTDWDYEDEYRLILHTDNENDFLRKAPIKEIYLGRDMLKEDKEFIKTMLGEMNAKKKPEEHIKLYSMGETDENIFQLVPTPEN